VNKAYYNENDPKAAAWLRELIKAGLIADGVVDERSITDVRADELDGFVQCHFFAGIGGWSYAFRLAGWPDDEPAWTGSCPCQPFSSAGKAQGLCDKRHLWPSFRGLISQRNPAIVFGEQVASKDGRAWLAGVRSDLEGMGYAVGAADLCAAGVCAPHIRQRLYWVANANGVRWNEQRGAKSFKVQGERPERTEPQSESGHSGQLSGRFEGLGASSVSLADATSSRCNREVKETEGEARDKTRVLVPGSSGGMGYTNNAGPQGRNGAKLPECAHEQTAWPGSSHLCRDGKTRRVPVEPAFFPLADGVPARVVRLRGYGNAIVPQVAAEFIQATREALVQ